MEAKVEDTESAGLPLSSASPTLTYFYLLQLTLAGVKAKVEDTESAGLPLSSASQHSLFSLFSPIAHLGRGGSKGRGHKICRAASILCLPNFLFLVSSLLKLTLAGVEAKVEDTKSASILCLLNIF